MSLKDSLSKIAKSVEGGAKSVVKGVGGGAKSVAKKSGDIVEASRINKEIDAEEEKINKIYFEIGKAVYEGNESFEDEVEKLCRDIDEIKENIFKSKERIAYLSGRKLCPNCRHELDLSILFCPMCGTKQVMNVMEEPQTAEEVEEQSSPTESNNECEECDCQHEGEENCSQKCSENEQ